MIKRIIFIITLILSAYLLPWWLTVLFMLISIFINNNFYEALIPALIIDVIYGSQYVGYQFNIPITLITLIVIFSVSNFKKKLLI